MHGADGLGTCSGKALKSGRHTAPDVAKTAFMAWRCDVTSWWISVLKPLTTIAVAASAARGLVAFATWRKSFRDRLIAAEPYSGEVS